MEGGLWFRGLEGRFRSMKIARGLKPKPSCSRRRWDPASLPTTRRDARPAATPWPEQPCRYPRRSLQGQGLNLRRGSLPVDSPSRLFSSSSTLGGCLEQPVEKSVARAVPKAVVRRRKMNDLDPGAAIFPTAVARHLAHPASRRRRETPGFAWL